MKSVLIIGLAFVFISCRSYNMIEGKSSPVYFTPDKSVFNDSVFQSQYLYYYDIASLRGNYLNVIELKKGVKSTAVIKKPTFVFGYDKCLVYPREKILVKKGAYNDYNFVKIHGSKRRNRELSFFTLYGRIKEFPQYSLSGNISIDSIRKEEVRLIKESSELMKSNALKFDSLCNKLRVSKRFKEIAKAYTQKTFLEDLYPFYKKNKDTLEAYNLYVAKCKSLIEGFGNVENEEQLLGILTSFNEIADVVLPYKIHKLSSAQQFNECFSSITKIYSGLPADYLLSRLMYQAYIDRISIDTAYEFRYNQIVTNNNYKALVASVKKQVNINLPENLKSDVALLSSDGKTIIDFENLMNKYKGKLIIVDFWATWCSPCLEDAKYMEQLVSDYPSNKLTLINVSIDNQIQLWRKFVIANREDRLNTNYLLLKSSNQEMIEGFNLQSIPRYMIINSNGEVIYKGTNGPQTLEFKGIIEKAMISS